MTPDQQESLNWFKAQLQLLRLTDEAKALVLDTVTYYTEDPSRIAWNGSWCQYLMADGRRCAGGRQIKDGCYNLIMEGNTVDDLIASHPLAFTDAALNNPHTMAKLQDWHDRCASRGSIPRTSFECLLHNLNPANAPK